MKEPPHPVLAQGKVRHVGDQVALVVAETLAAGEGRRRADRGRLRGAAGRGRHRARADSAAPARARRGAGQRLLRLGPRRQGGGRRGVREGRARDEARLRQQPADPERDRAARRATRATTARTTSYTLYVANQNPHVERLLMARVRARPAGIEGARHRARRRRRLRLEDLPLSGRRRAGLGEQARRPADQVDGRAQRSRSSPTRTAATTSRTPSWRSTRTASSSRCA